MITDLIVRATLRNLVKQAGLRKEAGYRRGPHISGEEALARLTKRAKSK